MHECGHWTFFGHSSTVRTAKTVHQCGTLNKSAKVLSAHHTNPCWLLSSVYAVAVQALL
jgi:hypothetical protein